MKRRPLISGITGQDDSNLADILLENEYEAWDIKNKII